MHLLTHIQYDTSLDFVANAHLSPHFPTLLSNSDHTCYKKQKINARMCLNTHACNICVYNINGTITSRLVSMLNKFTC